MDNNSVSKCTGGYGLSLALCSVLNALLVIAKEKSPAVYALMKKIGGHQWVGHVVVILVLFFVLGLVFTKAGAFSGSETAARRLNGMVIAGTLAGALIIMGFYLFAD